MNDPSISESMIDTLEDVVMERMENITKILHEKYLKNSFPLDMANVLNSCDTDNIEEKKELVSSLFKGKFPTLDWTIWTCEDSEGNVFGWSDTICLYIIGDPPKYIVEICPSFSIAQFDILLRKISLYKKKTGRTNLKVFVFTAILDEETRKEKTDFELIVRTLV